MGRPAASSNNSSQPGRDPMPRQVILIADPGIDTAFAVALALNDPNL